MPQELLVEKKVFHLPRYETVGGDVIADVRIGYETCGTLNERGDNAILVAHYFSGTSHCAGRYTPEDPAPGYWDAIIGPGKAVDTGRFFVISSDTLVNLNAHDKSVTTTGPASLNPATGRPYGMSFPLVSIRDFVRVQKALVDSLGVRKLHAVAGPSLGTMQAMEWAASYPDTVERVINVIGAGLEADPFLLALVDIWQAPILLDPHWNGGDYYGGTPPTRGLASALKTVTLTARHPGWAQPFGRKWATQGASPARAHAHRYWIEALLEDTGSKRAQVADANHFLYMVKAAQTWSLFEPEPRVQQLRAPVLFIPVASDLCMFPRFSHHAARVLREQGTPVELFELQTEGGHLDGIYRIQQASGVIAGFLQRPAR